MFFITDLLGRLHPTALRLHPLRADDYGSGGKSVLNLFE